MKFGAGGGVIEWPLFFFHSTVGPDEAFGNFLVDHFGVPILLDVFSFGDIFRDCTMIITIKPPKMGHLGEDLDGTFAEPQI